MKLSEILMGREARMKAVIREVNQIYLDNRWEFETTTVCREDGKVRYVLGYPKKPPVYKDGEEIEPGVIWHTLASWEAKK